MNIKVTVFPASDQRIQTQILTPYGWMHFQEWWVREKGLPKVLDVKFDGANLAKPAAGIVERIAAAERVIIGPSNPVTSIGPILAVKEIRESLKNTKGKVIAVSPIVGNLPVSGPAGNLMKALNIEASSLGVARMYEDSLDYLIVDKRDEPMMKIIEGETSVKVIVVNTIMKTFNDKVVLAKTVLEA